MRAHLMRTLGILSIIILSGCNKGKQEAVISIDEAKLAIASARRAGAETCVPAAGALGKAERLLSDAESSFRARDYRTAETKSAGASDSARAAEAQARERAYRAAPKAARRTPKARRQAGGKR